MIITHASGEKINEVTEMAGHDFLRGCLFFGSEGNTYNMALTGCAYQYNLEIDESKVIEVSRFFYDHSSDEPAVVEVLEALREELGVECSNEEMADIIDETADIEDYECSVDDGTARWLIQQYQGILAHKLGYDAAESSDEQGLVYIVYCVGKELKEVICEQ